MSSLGDLLRERREELKKTLQTVASETKIRETFLVIIESGGYDRLPSYIHAYGFIKKYAEYLGFQYSEIKQLFDEECPKPKNNNDISEDELDSNSAVTNKKSSAFLWVIAVIVIAVIIGIIVYNTVYNERPNPFSSSQNNTALNIQKEEPKVLTDNNSPVALESNIADNTTLSPMTPIEIPRQEEPTKLIEPKPIPVNRVPETTTPILPPVTKYIVLTFNDSCWVNYVPDNGTPQEFSATAGTKKSLPFIDFFTLDIGNAAAVTMNYGDNSFTGFGAPGIVIKMKYIFKDGSIERVKR